MEQHAAVARFAPPRLVGVLPPSEDHVQVVVLVLLLRDEITELGTFYVNRAFLDGEYVIGIVVLALLLEIRVEAIEILAVEQFCLGTEFRSCSQRAEGAGKQRKERLHCLSP